MLIRTVATALRAGGALLMTVGHHAWTGTEADWLGVAGATMFWSHEGEQAYRRWVIEAGLTIRRCEFVPEGRGGHSLILATKPEGGVKSLSRTILSDSGLSANELEGVRDVPYR